MPVRLFSSWCCMCLYSHTRVLVFVSARKYRKMMLQLLDNNRRFAALPHNRWPLYQGQANGNLSRPALMIILSSKSNGNCIKDSPRTIAAGRAKPLGLALEAQAAIAPHKQFINCRPARDLVKAGPDGQFVQACSNRKDQSLRSSSRRLDPLLRRVSSLSTAGFDRAPMASSQEGQTLDRAFGGSTRYCAT